MFSDDAVLKAGSKRELQDLPNKDISNACGMETNYTDKSKLVVTDKSKAKPTIKHPDFLPILCPLGSSLGLKERSISLENPRFIPKKILVCKTTK